MDARRLLRVVVRAVFAVCLLTLLAMIFVSSFSNPDRLKSLCESAGGERVTQDICVSSDGRVLIYLRHGRVMTPGTP